MELPVISKDCTVQSAYEEMRRAGQSHNIAEMLALRRLPACKTDREFLAGHCNGSQFAKDAVLGNRYKEVAEQRGADVTGKVYLSGLAAFPGDPRAWVADRSDAEKVIRERGWSSEGLINVKGQTEGKPSEPIPLADDLAEHYADKEIIAEPKLALKPRQEVKEMVTEKYGRRK